MVQGRRPRKNKMALKVKKLRNDFLPKLRKTKTGVQEKVEGKLLGWGRAIPAVATRGWPYTPFTAVEILPLSAPGYLCLFDEIGRAHV